MPLPMALQAQRSLPEFFTKVKLIFVNYSLGSSGFSIPTSSEYINARSETA
nr:MAG TPA: hypothetical protein [Caudoviricetes sp.]